MVVHKIEIFDKVSNACSHELVVRDAELAAIFEHLGITKEDVIEVVPLNEVCWSGLEMSRKLEVEWADVNAYLACVAGPGGRLYFDRQPRGEDGSIDHAR